MMPTLMISILMLSLGTCAYATEKHPFRVVLDPGHGGTDLGAIATDQGQVFAEKDSTLALAMDVAKRLRARGAQVILTRTTDRDVTLSERTALANRLHADLFLSIHMNSGSHALLGGIETYILNHTTDASSKRLAQLENTSNRPNLPQLKATAPAPGTDSSDATDVALIVKDLTLEADRPESMRLACAIQKQLVLDPSRPHDRGVKQALFHVLLGADMPSALLEAGFINHAQDRIRVVGRDSRARMADAIASAMWHFWKTRGSVEATREVSRCLIR